MIAPLLFLMSSLLPSIEADAQPGHFSPNPSARDLIENVNALRASQDLAPYKMDAALMKIAQSHAQYISATGVLTHFDDQGRRPYQRALDAGYAVGGNLALGGSLTEAIHSGSSISEADAVAAWQASPADSLALLSADYEDIGAGIAAANGITYYVLVAASEGASTPNASPTVGTQPAGTLTGVANTALPSGDLYHTVQKNEALWSIALLYGTTIAELKSLNGLAGDEIFEGQQLLIRRAPTETPTPTAPAITATLGIPTSTATQPVTPTPTHTPTPLPTAPASLQNGGMMAGGIILIALLAAGLVAFIGAKKRTDSL